MKKICCLAVAVLSLCACTGLKTAVKDGQIAPQFADTLQDDTYLWVRGFGAANPKHTNSSQRRILAREAAIAQAYQRAAEVLLGAQVESDVQIVDAVSDASAVHTSTQGLLSQMELVSTEYLQDDGCTVIMRLKRKNAQPVETKE